MFGFLAFFVGALTALQSRANGRLAIHLNNGILAGLVSNLTGWSLIFIILAFSKKDRTSFIRVLKASRHREIKLFGFSLILLTLSLWEFCARRLRVDELH